ncbi:FixH family protein [Bacillus sp. FJAT-49736]|uniref:FixH family protein n=1 Tax=Bacillus sp. FJAT-49736 TaxID=2833582 RepID=UPI001BC9DCB3|nr:FixH family protein [Bacillus sp. FJAT-49736]MBS4171972.1 FixH family protein [Bacillus sp. FJAT-49736]
MSRKIFIGFFICLTVIVLSACGSNQSNTYDKKVPVELTVALKVPDKANVNDKVSLQALVTQGKEKVKDADEVKYQIWEGDNINNSKYINAKNDKNGNYTAEAMFDHSGTYQIQVHVTARGQHVMPKAKIIINTK